MDKKCFGCGQTLPSGGFFKCASRPDGLQTRCKGCQTKKRVAHRLAHIDHERAAQRKLYALSPEKHNLRKKAWRAANPDKAREICAKHRKTFPEKVAAASRKWIAENPERRREMTRNWYRKNSIKAAKWARDYRNASIARMLHSRISGRIREAFAKGRRSIGTMLPYTMLDLKHHLEKQFVDGMNWENRGKWHIDHIVPLASFKITGPDCPELQVAWGLPNLRPLWAIENRRKHDKRTHLL